MFCNFIKLLVVGFFFQFILAVFFLMKLFVVFYAERDLSCQHLDQDDMLTSIGPGVREGPAYM